MIAAKMAITSLRMTGEVLSRRRRRDDVITQ
jgi:hypothetical protein